MPDQRTHPDVELVAWTGRYAKDMSWLAVEISLLKRYALDIDPTVELVVAHPDLPGEGPWWFMGLRAERGALGVRVQRRA